MFSRACLTQGQAQGFSFPFQRLACALASCGPSPTALSMGQSSLLKKYPAAHASDKRGTCFLEGNLKGGTSGTCVSQSTRAPLITLLEENYQNTGYLDAWY